MFKLNKMLALLIALTLLLGACTTPPAAPAVEKTQAVVVTEAPKPAETEALKPTAVPTDVPEPTEAPPDFLALFTDGVAKIAGKGFGTVAAKGLNEELADKAPFIVDVREPAEVEKDGYIQGSVNIPVRDILKNLDKLPGLDEPIVVTCASGHRGGQVMIALQMLGYTNVRNLGGGIGAWKKAELPVETGLPPAAEKISTPIVENAALFTALDEYFSGLPDGFYSTKADVLNEALASGTPPTVIDVRSDEERSKDGSIEGDVHIPFDKFFTSLDQVPTDKDAPIVVYCASGHRGGMAMMGLRLLGYTNVLNLGGGLGAWKAAKMPVVGGALDWTAIWTDYTKNLPAGFYTISAADLNTALADQAPFVLDVREQAEVEKDGFIAGAAHIPARDVLKNLDKLPALDQPIVVYCASGHRGGFIMAALQVLGYQDVKNLGGGLGAWKKAELAVETDLAKLVAPEAGEAPAVDAARLADLTAAIDALPEGFAVLKAADLQTELAADGAPLVIDLRPTEDFDKGHIEGSVSMPINTVLADLTLLPAEKDAPIVVVCQSGHRGGIMLLALRMMGYTNIRNLGGGVNAWTAAELPLVQ